MVNSLNNKKGIVVIVALSLILLVALFLGSIEDKKLRDNDIKEYEESIIVTNQEKDLDVEKEQKQEIPKVEEKNFYMKLSNKEKVNILITGDRIALSEGKNSENGLWSEGVSYIINKNYNSSVELNMLAKQDISVQGGQDLLSKNNTSIYDLIIFCFGHNDSIMSLNVDEFKSTYNKIVSEIKSKNKIQNLILMIPSTLNDDDKYRSAIIEVAKENGLVCVDTKVTLDNSKIPKKNLLNGKLPNDLGYQLYTEAISKVISEGAQKIK